MIPCHYCRNWRELRGCRYGLHYYTDDGELRVKDLDECEKKGMDK